MAHEVTALPLKMRGWTKNSLKPRFFPTLSGGCFPISTPYGVKWCCGPWGSTPFRSTNVENACAGASTALHLAYTGIRAGMYDVALAVGSEKITDPDKMKSLSAYATCMDVGNFERPHPNDGRAVNKFPGGIPRGRPRRGKGAPSSWMPMPWGPGGT
jgi:acetyl-CoA acyltransferase